MKNIYFVQAAKNHNDSTVYIPYASGCLIAYALQNKEISSNYRFKDIVFLRDKIETVMASINDPYLLAFSCSLWNAEYSKALARRVKETYPHCLVIFGGHYVSNKSDLLEECPFIDFTVHGEGEHAFSSLLVALLKSDDLDISNLSYRDKNGIVKNKVSNDYELDTYPSPYLIGIFDDYFKKYPTLEFHTILETNRGCPYSCAFCEWCFTKNIRYFPLEKVMKEIDWMSKNEIEYCYCADANFGIATRDVDIARYLVCAREKNGYPKIFRPTYAKNSNETVFEAGKALHTSGADKGVTISYQSLNPRTLELIGRKEIDMNTFSDLAQKYSAAGIPTYTELILGLPGETYESFCKGLCHLLEAGQHNSIAVYQCQIYTNALMCNKNFQKEHGIKTARVPVNGAHYKLDFNGITEYYDVVIGTADMSTKEWVKANMFSVVLQAFHNLGLLRYFAIYLYHEQGITYFEFYNRLLSYILDAQGTFLQKIFLDFENRFSDTKTGDWIYSNKDFGDIGWYFDEAAFLELLRSEDLYWKNILPFLSNFHISADIFKDLLNYQKFIIRRPNNVWPNAEFTYDFSSYFDKIYCDSYHSLTACKCRVRINTKIFTSSWKEYAMKIVLSGKRRGETIYTSEKGSVTIENI